MGGPAKIDGIVYPITDNFYECTFIIDNKKYCSSENYFQAMKATNDHDHDRIRDSGPGMGCWHTGSMINLRHDW
jgi:predicted NAD-dependent protein-ADP-ribosyltransferase YbiA (DUF1768 family)